MLVKTDFVNFANILDPDQTRQYVGPDLDANYSVL